MTDKQRLAKLQRAETHLKQTTRGYTPNGVHWRVAMELIDEVEQDLAGPPKPGVPALGPVWKGGKSVLLHDLTHATSGIPLYPAFDDAFVQGREIIAPENLRVTDDSSSRPGDAFYATGQSKLRWWFGHLATAPAVGREFTKGQVLGKVGANALGGGPHVHVGINVELLLGNGKQLIHHVDYTHGAPTVGVQLTKALST